MDWDRASKLCQKRSFPLPGSQVGASLDVTLHGEHWETKLHHSIRRLHITSRGKQTMFFQSKGCHISRRPTLPMSITMSMTYMGGSLLRLGSAVARTWTVLPNWRLPVCQPCRLLEGFSKVRFYPHHARPLAICRWRPSRSPTFPVMWPASEDVNSALATVKKDKEGSK
jgi:hypothetical protein